MKTEIFHVESGDPRTRLDRFLAARLLPEYSRSRIARMIRAGLVTVNGEAARPSNAIHVGDRVELSQAPAAEPHPAPSGAPEVPILFADDELIVVNKPAGLAVHGAAGYRRPTLVDALIARFPDLGLMNEPDGVMRPGIVHRLDKDTSGVMVVARTPFARMVLASQFKERTVRKTYLAIVRGLVSKNELTIVRPIGRHRTQRKRMSVRSSRSRPATSLLWVLKRFEQAHGDGSRAALTLVKVRPQTGRTHQIRVHLSSIGHPCLGDPVYGRSNGACDTIQRQALHAVALELAHPRTGERIRFVAPLPQDLLASLRAGGLSPEPAEVELWAR